MDTYNVHSPDVIATNIIRDITQVRGLTLAAAARLVGKTPQNFHNMLSGKSRFSKKTAILLNDKFKYSITYLTQGIGQLYDSWEDNPLSERMETVEPSADSSTGFFFHSSSALTEREALLNEYAKKYSHLYEEVNLTVSGRSFDLSEVFSETDAIWASVGINPKSVKEYGIIKSILAHYVLIKTLLDPKFIADELESM